RKTHSLSRLLRSRCIHLSRIEKAFTDLNTTRKPLEKWQAFCRMWSNILYPPVEDVIKMNALVAPDRTALVWARILTPWRIYRVFARDVGGKIFVAIMIKCAFDVVSATVRAPFARAATQLDHEAFARQLGLSLDDLQRLKETLE